MRKYCVFAGGDGPRRSQAQPRCICLSSNLSFRRSLISSRVPLPRTMWWLAGRSRDEGIVFSRNLVFRKSENCVLYTINSWSKMAKSRFKV
ncbi:hypothetical protein BKA93DRAFT_763368 [Sparassis latifolia]